MASNYYVVKKGFKPGIYKTWAECETNVENYIGAVYKKFNNIFDADNYLNDSQINKLLDDNTKCNSNKKNTSINDDNDKYHSDHTYLFCDGSAIHDTNYKSIRCGFGIFINKTNKEYLTYSQELINSGTNNLAELNALLAALKIIKKIESKLSIIVSDSKYALSCLLIWLDNWKKNNWLTSKKTPVENVDLIKEIDKYYHQLLEDGYNIKFKHINSHQTKPKENNTYQYFLWYGNEMADQLARLGEIHKEFDEPEI
jgi:ribonuclease HI